MRSAFPSSDSYMRQGVALAGEMAAYARGQGAGSADVEKVARIAERALPIALFELHAGEIEPGPAAFSSCLRLVSAGISAAALTRRDIPLAIRERLMPALRPDTFDTHISWWDKTALPRWVGPFFMDLDARGLFDQATCIETVECVPE